MEYRIGEIVTGKVIGVQPYGVFLSLDQKTTGLIHISEIRDDYVQKLDKLFSIGDTFLVQIIDIDGYTEKISCSLRMLSGKRSRFYSQQFYQKTFYTTREVKTGFTAIQQKLAGWVQEALKDLGIKKNHS